MPQARHLLLTSMWLTSVCFAAATATAAPATGTQSVPDESAKSATAPPDASVPGASPGESVTPPEEGVSLSLGLRLTLTGTRLDATHIRQALEAELDVAVELRPDGPLELTVTGQTLKARFTRPASPHDSAALERTMTLPEPEAEQLETIALLCGSLLRDEASELLLTLQSPGAVVEAASPPPPAAPPPSESPPAPEAATSAGDEGANQLTPLREGPVALMVTPGVSVPREPEELSAALTFGLLTAKVGRVSGFGVSVISLRSLRGAKGLSVAGFVQRTDGPAQGVSVAVASNRLGAPGERSSGLQVAAGLSRAEGLFSGLQVAAVASSREALSGAQVGLVSLAAGRVHGLQTGLYSRAGGEVSGLQVGLATSATGPVHGLQVGLATNATGPVHGVQIGLVNIAQTGQHQVGLFNFSRHGQGARVGLLSLGEGVRTQLVAWGSSSGLTANSPAFQSYFGHLGLRALSGPFLSMIHVGVGADGEGCTVTPTACPVWLAPGLTLGGRISLTSWLKLDLDGQYRYRFASAGAAPGVQSVGPRVSLVFAPVRSFEAFLGGGVEWTWTTDSAATGRLLDHLFAGVAFF